MNIVQFVMFGFALWAEVLKMGGGNYENIVKYFVLIFLRERYTYLRSCFE